jgi:Dyp-type peroxidase family
LALQICADNLYVCEHVVRRIEDGLGAELGFLATYIGSQRYTTRAGRTSRHEGRALIGFLDGTSNLDPRNSDADAKLVFIDPAAVVDYPKNPPNEPSEEYGGGRPFPDELTEPPAHEPEWAAAGTYMTVRASTFPTAVWDQLSQNAQEQAVGRFKVSGASLDLADDSELLTAEPKFATEPNDLAVALRAHIRKANPRRQGQQDDQRRIFRRGYPLIAAAETGLKRGLIFIAFARSISTQFEFIVRAWMRNPDFPAKETGTDTLFAQLGEEVLGGGYYFVPPLKNRAQPWTWQLPGVF